MVHKTKSEIGQKGKLTDVQKNEIKTMFQGLINVLQYSDITKTQEISQRLRNKRDEVLGNLRHHESLEKRKRPGMFFMESKEIENIPTYLKVPTVLKLPEIEPSAPEAPEEFEQLD